MGKAIDATLDQEVYDGLTDYLDQEFGNNRAQSLIVNLAVRQFLQRKGILPNHQGRGKTGPDQSSLFKELGG